MSWSVSYSNVNGKNPDFSLDKTDYPESSAYIEKSEEMQNQHSTACEVATTIINSGKVGNPEEFTFRVCLSGHANPEHKPTDGMANDFITVSIYQETAKKPGG